jgi:parvulin-like peptidyl-prolyl isomerase
MAVESGGAPGERGHHGTGAWVLALGALLLFGCGLGCERREPASDAEDLVLAEVGPYKITRKDFDRRLGQLDESLRKNFSTPDQQAQFLQTLVEEKLILLAAESKDLEREPEVQDLLADRRTQILVRQYMDAVLVPQAAADSNDVARYYAENPAEFKVAERVSGRQIVTTTAASAQAIRRRLLAGESFDSLLPQSIDPQTRNLGGALGYVQRDVPVRGVGQNPAFIESLLALPVGAVSRPLKTSVGYHVVKIEAHEPERVRDLEAVRPALERKLGPKKFEMAFRHTIDSLRGEYKVTVNEQGLLGAEGVAERQSRLLFDQAQQAADPVARLKLYEQIVAEYGDSKYGAQAQFMIGFMYADELKDPVKGRAAFEQMIARYGKAPYVDSTLVDSARWMLKNMDLPAPALEGGPPAPAGQHGATPLGTGTPDAAGASPGGASNRD